MSLTPNLPEVIAEVTAAFERYERALTTNDLATLDELFWDSPHTVRYGIFEQLYGIDEVRAFRAGRRVVDLGRELTRVAIRSYGRDFATASCEFRRLDSGRRGRQMQTWVRMPQLSFGGWRVVAAHVSFAQEPPAA
ncbi:MAG: oxalurate catabolism protein HpxZ [Betaproteobacteria bacterium]